VKKGIRVSIYCEEKKVPPHQVFLDGSKRKKGERHHALLFLSQKRKRGKNGVRELRVGRACLQGEEEEKKVSAQSKSYKRGGGRGGPAGSITVLKKAISQTLSNLGKERKGGKRKRPYGCFRKGLRMVHVLTKRQGGKEDFAILGGGGRETEETRDD